MLIYILSNFLEAGCAEEMITRCPISRCFMVLQTVVDFRAATLMEQGPKFSSLSCTSSSSRVCQEGALTISTWIYCDLWWATQQAVVLTKPWKISDLRLKSLDSFHWMTCNIWKAGQLVAWGDFLMHLTFARPPKPAIFEMKRSGVFLSTNISFAKYSRHHCVTLYRIFGQKHEQSSLTRLKKVWSFMHMHCQRLWDAWQCWYLFGFYTSARLWEDTGQFVVRFGLASSLYIMQFERVHWEEYLGIIAK